VTQATEEQLKLELSRLAQSDDARVQKLLRELARRHPGLAELTGKAK
jgi:hypothetical protein